MTPVSLGDSVFLHFGTTSTTTGAATNADSTPTVNVAEDGVALGYAPTVTNITTGLYMVQIDCTGGNGFEAGRRYSVYVAATVGTIAGRDGIGEFEVLATDLNTGVASVVGAVGSVTGSVGSVVGLTAANLDVAVSTRLAAASYTAPLDAAATRAALGLAAANLDTQLGALPTAAENATAVLDEIIEAALSLRQAMRLCIAAMGGKASGLETTTAVYRDSADTKDRITATVDANGNRTAVTLDLT
jgi:hypothetical protein